MKRLKERVHSTWGELRQQRLFTIIYVAGTALAITFTMIYSLVYYVNIADIYPETNRSKTMYVDWFVTVDSTSQGYIHVCNFSKEAFDSVLYRSKNVEVACAIYQGCATTLAKTSVKGDRGQQNVAYKSTDPNFFRIYSYEFLQGKPFTWDDMEARNQQAVITDRLSEQLFGKDMDVVGKEIQVDVYDPTHQEDKLESLSRYRICGVVKGGSSLTERSYAEIFLPYTAYHAFDYWHKESNWSLSAIFMVNDHQQAMALKEELKGLGRRMVASNPDYKEFWIERAIIDHSSLVLRQINTPAEFIVPPAKEEFYYHIALVFLVLLVVPALNLCGLVAGRMEERLGEMAVRKSFGASRRTLLWQVIRENMRLTLLGGIVGLLLSIFIIQVMGEWVFGLFYDQNMVAECPDLSVTTFFSPIVFLTAFAFSGVLNLLAALIPAWWSLRRPIVESLMTHK